MKGVQFEHSGKCYPDNEQNEDREMANEISNMKTIGNQDKSSCRGMVDKKDR